MGNVYAYWALLKQPPFTGICENHAYLGVEPIIPLWHCNVMKNIARIRERKRLTQSQLAEMVGANQATISKIEAGSGNPTVAMLNRIAAALEVHPSDLFSRDELEERALAALNSLDNPQTREAAVIVLESMASPSK